MNTLKVPNYQEYETKIISCKGSNRELIEHVRTEVTNFIKDLDYIMQRFLDQFGVRLEEDQDRNSVYQRFTNDKSRQYADATRMIRLIDFYSK